MQNFNFVGNKDVDELILMNLDYNDLKSMRKVNKYINSICDEAFWKKYIIEKHGLTAAMTRKRYQVKYQDNQEEYMRNVIDENPSLFVDLFIYDYDFHIYVMRNYEDMDKLFKYSDNQLITLIYNGIYIHDILYNILRKRNRNKKSLKLFQKLSKLDYDEIYERTKKKYPDSDKDYDNKINFAQELVDLDKTIPRKIINLLPKDIKMEFYQLKEESKRESSYMRWDE